MFFANKRAIRKLNQILKTLDKVKNNDFFIQDELHFKFGSNDRQEFRVKMTETQASVLDAIRYLYD